MYWIKTGLLIFIFLSPVLSAVGQPDCKCDNYEDVKRQYDAGIDQNNYSRSRKSCYDLIQNENPICRIMGYDLAIGLANSLRELDSTSFLLQQEAKLIEGIDCDQSYRMEYHLSYANFLFEVDSLDKSTEQYYKALEIADELGNYERKAYSLVNLAVIFSRLEQRQKAVDFCRKALEALKKSSTSRLKTGIKLNIASLYMRYNSISSEPSLTDTALVIVREAIVESREQGYAGYELMGYQVLSDIYYQNQEYQAAISLLDSAAYLAKKGDFFRDCYNIYMGLTDNYLRVGKTRNAVATSDSCLHYASLIGTPKLVASAYKKCFEAYMANNNFQTALKYHIKYTEITDSLISTENFAIVNELEQKYRNKENQEAIFKLSQESQILLQRKKIDAFKITILGVGVGLLLAITLVVILLYRQSRIRKKMEILDFEQRLNRSRLNPHFIFNALASVQSLSLIDDRKGEVPVYLSKFAKIMRKILEGSYSELIPIEEEVEFITEYLEVQKLRYAGKFNYEIHIDNGLNPDELLLPAMILQPFLENSIEHGFRDINYQGQLKINFSISKSNLIVQVFDNGKVEKEGGNSKFYPSRSTQITKDRLFLFNKKHRSNAKFDFVSNESGSIVTIYFPILVI